MPHPAMIAQSNQQEKLMGELQRLTAYTNQRYENMVYQKKVRAAVRRVLVSPSPFFS